MRPINTEAWVQQLAAMRGNYTLLNLQFIVLFFRIRKKKEPLPNGLCPKRLIDLVFRIVDSTQNLFVYLYLYFNTAYTRKNATDLLQPVATFRPDTGMIL